MRSDSARGLVLMVSALFVTVGDDIAVDISISVRLGLSFAYVRIIVEYVAEMLGYAVDRFDRPSLIFEGLFAFLVCWGGLLVPAVVWAPREVLRGARGA